MPGNWVWLGHGEQNPDSTVEVPAESHITYWANAQAPVLYGTGAFVVSRLWENPLETHTIARFVVGLDPEQHRSAKAGVLVDNLDLVGDDKLECGLIDLTHRVLYRALSQDRTTVRDLLYRWGGNIHLICCRGSDGSAPTTLPELEVKSLQNLPATRV